MPPMNPRMFLRTPEARAVLDRASQGAAMPVAVHALSRAGDASLVLSCGSCNACRHVAKLPGGAAACESSRTPSLRDALHRGQPSGFVCHMGFACLSMAVPFNTPVNTPARITLTLGPYCPAEAPGTLQADFREGLTALGVLPDPILPVPLSDVAFVSASTVPALAEWTAETLIERWAAAQRSGDDPPSEDAASTESHAIRPSRGSRGRLPEADPYAARTVVAALASGDRAGAKALLLSALNESTVRRLKTPAAALRARVLAVVAATIEAAARAGLDTDPCWRELPKFLGETEQLTEPAGCVQAALRLVARAMPPANAGGDALRVLRDVLCARIDQRITLAALAAELGKHPTAITHQLQRRFGMSFSQYVGRLRVDKAKDLFRRTRLGVGDVAQRVGIPDSSNFSRLFRKFEGCSPSDYQARFWGSGS